MKKTRGSEEKRIKAELAVVASNVSSRVLLRGFQVLGTGPEGPSKHLI